MKKPELLSPAGTLKNLQYAVAYGADAVYAGLPRYSLRVRNNEFDLETMAAAIQDLHKAGKRLHAVANIQPHNSKLKTFVRDMGDLIALGPDALIMSDPGLIMMVRESFPDVPIHLSVQTNTINYASVKFWERQGIRRIILSRELSLDEIAEIRQQCPDIELEVFIHGALCMAYSGRCLLSGYLNHRDSNQGACTNACRWKYTLHPAREDSAGDLVIANGNQDPDIGLGPVTDRSYFITEPGRPEEPMPAEEDIHGTYIMNSRDLCAVRHVKRLTEIGIDSLKIEGRTKSFYYCARTANIYRKAIDLAVQGEEVTPEILAEVNTLANRGWTDGFLARHPIQDYQNYEWGNSVTDGSQVVGEVLDIEEDGTAKIAVRNRFDAGDRIEILTPGKSFFMTAEAIFEKGVQVPSALGDGHTVTMKTPARPENARFALIVRLPKEQASA